MWQARDGIPSSPSADLSTRAPPGLSSTLSEGELVGVDVAAEQNDGTPVGIERLGFGDRVGQAV
jgi:hypothetical protein